MASRTKGSKRPFYPMADVHLSQPNVTSSSQATCTLQVVHHAYWNINFPAMVR